MDFGQKAKERGRGGGAAEGGHQIPPPCLIGGLSSSESTMYIYCIFKTNIVYIIYCSLIFILTLFFCIILLINFFLTLLNLEAFVSSLAIGSTVFYDHQPYIQLYIISKLCFTHIFCRLLNEGYGRN